MRDVVPEPRERVFHGRHVILYAMLLLLMPAMSRCGIELVEGDVVVLRRGGRVRQGPPELRAAAHRHFGTDLGLDPGEKHLLSREIRVQSTVHVPQLVTRRGHLRDTQGSSLGLHRFLVKPLINPRETLEWSRARVSFYGRYPKPGFFREAPVVFVQLVVVGGDDDHSDTRKGLK